MPPNVLTLDPATADLSMELLASLSCEPADAETLMQDLQVGRKRFSGVLGELFRRGYDVRLNREPGGRIDSVYLGHGGIERARADAANYLDRCGAFAA